MSHPKDLVGKTLRKCLKALKMYHQLALGGDWREADELEALIKEVEKTIAYREVQS
jgi:hypothetical protein